MPRDLKSLVGQTLHEMWRDCEVAFWSPCHLRGSIFCHAACDCMSQGGQDVASEQKTKAGQWLGPLELQLKTARKARLP